MISNILELAKVTPLETGAVQKQVKLRLMIVTYSGTTDWAQAYQQTPAGMLFLGNCNSPECGFLTVIFLSEPC